MGSEKHGRILKIESHDIHHNFPGGRCQCGSGVPPETPVKNLYNVGDGVVPGEFPGVTGPAQSAKMVVEDIKKRVHIRG